MFHESELLQQATIPRTTMKILLQMSHEISLFVKNKQTESTTILNRHGRRSTKFPPSTHPYYDTCYCQSLPNPYTTITTTMHACLLLIPLLCVCMMCVYNASLTSPRTVAVEYVIIPQTVVPSQKTDRSTGSYLLRLRRLHRS